MNQLGEEYIKKTNSYPCNGFKAPKWTDGVFQERLMRCGVEFKLYNIESYEGIGFFDPNEVQNIVIATLREDYHRKQQ